MSAQPPIPRRSAQHLVSRVSWDTMFDVHDEVHAQQDWLSAFSREALPRLFDEVFADTCPADVLWRCDRLVLDLGRIAVSDLADELPRRLRRSLADALHARFDDVTRRRPDVDTIGRHDQADPLQRMPAASDSDPSGSPDRDDVALLVHLLLHGSLPWWRERPLSLAAHWDALCNAEDTAPLVACLWRIGRHQNVRERLVWQLGVPRMPLLLRLLLPVHADALNAWVGEVVGRQVAARLVPDHANDFEGEAWLALLTCLMADRGSVSNTVAFAYRHLECLAARYGIAIDVLLARLQDSSERHVSILPRGFVGLVRAVCAQGRPQKSQSSQSIAPDDWQQWHALLGQDRPAGAVTGAGHRVSSLFQRLARSDHQRLARDLRRRPSTAVIAFTQHLDERALRRLVAVLEPQHAGFLLDHVALMQGLTSRDGLAKSMVWRLVLDALLTVQRSHVDRARLVEQTLRAWCRQHNRALAPSLEAMVSQVRHQAAEPQRYALLRILVELQRASAPQTSATAPPTLLSSRVDPPRYRSRERRGSRESALLPVSVPVSQLWSALRWRLRGERAAPGLPEAVAALSLEQLWQRLPEAEIRRWLLRQPDRDRLLPSLLCVSGARRWLHRMMPRHLRALPAWIEDIRSWWGDAGNKRGHSLEAILWCLALDSRARNVSVVEWLAHGLLRWCRVSGVAAVDAAQRGLRSAQGSEWRQACRRLLDWVEGRPLTLPDAASTSLDVAARHLRPDAWGAWLRRPEAQAWVLRLLCQPGPIAIHRRHGVAGWPDASASFDQTNAEARLAAAVFDLAWQHPHALRRALAAPWRRATLRHRLEHRLRMALPLPHLLDLLRRTLGSSSVIVSLLAAWQQWQRHMPLPNPEARELWLWRVVWQAWLDQDWRRLEASHLIATFCQWFLPLAGGDAVLFARSLRATAVDQPHVLSEALLTTLRDDGTLASEHVSMDAMPAIPLRAEIAPSQRTAERMSPQNERQRLPVPNAGLVLLHTYLPTLFDRFSLLRDRRFVDPAAIHRAVLSLHYLSSGRCHADEPQLALNKVLCGELPSRPTPLSFAPETGDIDTMDGLLRAVCAHWPRGGSTTADALRGNWLLRPGVLSDAEDHWSLVVERKPWDVLLANCPFTRSVIKPPWMTKPLYVTWAH